MLLVSPAISTLESLAPYLWPLEASHTSFRSCPAFPSSHYWATHYSTFCLLRAGAGAVAAVLAFRFSYFAMRLDGMGKALVRKFRKIDESVRPCRTDSSSSTSGPPWDSVSRAVIAVHATSGVVFTTLGPCSFILKLKSESFVRLILPDMSSSTRQRSSSHVRLLST